MAVIQHPAFPIPPQEVQVPADIRINLAKGADVLAGSRILADLVRKGN